MRLLFGLLLMAGCCEMCSAQVPTLEELDALVNKNAEAVQVNASNIRTLNNKLAKLEAKCDENACTCEDKPVRLASTASEASYEMPELLEYSNRIDELTQMLKSLKVSSAPLSQVTTTPVVTSSTPVVSYGPVTTRTVSVGEPFVVPNSTYTTSSRTCNNPFCTDPNCPNRATNLSSGFTNVSNVSTPLRYTSRVRGRTKAGWVCDGDKCWKIR